MMWLAENIQACLRIFRRAQQQWLVRDILHQPQGVFYCFCLMAQIEVQEVQKVQIHPIRLIRVEKKLPEDRGSIALLRLRGGR